MLLDSSELDEDRVKGVKWTTPFIQRLQDRRNGGDFKFTLDDLDEYCKITKPDGEQNMVPVNLFFLLDRMDRYSITAHARRAGMMAAYAPEIRDRYACQRCARKGLRCYRVEPRGKRRTGHTDCMGSVKCARCCSAAESCDIIGDDRSFYLACKNKRQVDADLLDRPLTITGVAFDSWPDLLEGLGQDRHWANLRDRLGLREVLLLFGFKPDKDGLYHVMLRNLDAKQTGRNYRRNSRKKQPQGGQEREYEGSSEEDDGNDDEDDDEVEVEVEDEKKDEDGNEDEEKDEGEDGDDDEDGSSVMSKRAGKQPERRSERIGGMTRRERRSKRNISDRDDSAISVRQTKRARPTRDHSSQANLNIPPRQGGPSQPVIHEIEDSDDDVKPMVAAVADPSRDLAISYHKSLLDSLVKGYDRAKQRAASDWLDRTMEECRALVGTDWKGMDNTNQMVMQKWLAFFTEAMLLQPWN